MLLDLILFFFAIYIIILTINLTIELISKKQYVYIIATIPLYAIAVYIIYHIIIYYNVLSKIIYLF